MANKDSNKGWNIALWVVQILLALLFCMAGAMKSMAPIEQLAPDMAWVTRVPLAVVRLVGVAELLGAIGLIAPSVLRIKPKLTVFAAAGLVTVMVLAAILHLTSNEAAIAPVNMVLGALAGFVAWGRLKKAPIEPR